MLAIKSHRIIIFSINIFALMMMAFPPVTPVSYDRDSGNNGTILSDMDDWDAKIKVGILPSEFKGIFIPPDYDKYSKVNETGTTVRPPELTVSIRALDFVEDSQNCNVSVGVAYSWTDPRLRFTEEEQGGYYLVPSALKYIWKPYLYVAYNLEDEDVVIPYPLPQPTLENSVLIIRDYKDDSGNRTDFVRFEATVFYWFIISSGGGYTYYPYDKHEFRFNIGKGLHWNWVDPDTGFFLPKKLKHSSFHIVVSSRREESNEIYVPGKQFAFVVLFVRKVQSQLIRIYIPSGLFVVLCWLSMFLPVELASERVALCTGTLLTITMFFNTASQLGPIVNYLRALDVWLLGCITFIFIILFENVAVMKITGRFNKILPKTGDHDDKMEKAFKNILQLHLGSLRGGDESGELGGRGEEDDEVGRSRFIKSAKLTEAKKNDELQVGGGNQEKTDDSAVKFLAAVRLDRASVYGLTAGILVFNVVYWIWLLASNQTAD